MKTVLLSAYACGPFNVSEAGAAWMQVEAILRKGKYHIILLTRKKYIDSIQKYTQENRLDHQFTLVGIDLPKPLLFWKRGHLAIHIYYYIWQLVAFIQARTICQQRSVDVAHHISFMTIRSNMVAFLKVPSILGPVGGAQLPPPGFSDILLHPVKERVRHLSLLLMKYSPFWLLFIRRISVIYLANHDNTWLLPTDCNYCILQIGWPCSEGATIHRQQNDTIQIFWGGRIIGWKGLELLLRALPGLLSTKIKFHLNITGKGPDEQRMKDYVSENSLNEHVSFHGWVSIDRKEELQNKADICVFTSLHETTGTALFEMMEKGKALIVVNHAGPGEIVDSHSAMLIETVNGTNHAIDQIVTALYTFSNDREMREHYAVNARKRLMERYNWDSYINTICETYDELSL